MLQIGFHNIWVTHGLQIYLDFSQKTNSTRVSTRQGLSEICIYGNSLTKDLSHTKLAFSKMNSLCIRWYHNFMQTRNGIKNSFKFLSNKGSSYRKLEHCCWFRKKMPLVLLSIQVVLVANQTDLGIGKLRVRLQGRQRMSEKELN